MLAVLAGLWSKAGEKIAVVGGLFVAGGVAVLSLMAKGKAQGRAEAAQAAQAEDTRNRETRDAVDRNVARNPDWADELRGWNRQGD